MKRKLAAAVIACGVLATACASGGGGQSGFVGKLAAGQGGRAVTGVATPNDTAGNVPGAEAAAAGATPVAAGGTGTNPSAKGKTGTGGGATNGTGGG
ncbi:MAG: hypothetical protein JOZ37_12110, partial [Actinobacteria bacterium]|nr:hypothetical protein [Actinomycetota bacterium]